MDEITRYPGGLGGGPLAGTSSGGSSGNSSGGGLLDVLDRVLDKGVVIAGDIKINLLDIELLTIKIRLLIASADKAREMGIDWWAHDPQLSSAARRQQQKLDADRENRDLRERVDELEARLAAVLEQQEDRPARLPAPAPGRRLKAGQGD